MLPSTLQAYTESPIYARTSGYLGRWYKDIGSRVKKDELLADIETPEVDQELMQARAARDQAEAQLKLAQSSAKRWENLQNGFEIFFAALIPVAPLREILRSQKTFHARTRRGSKAQRQN